ncbi:MAG: hypothetical protein QXD03_05390 [Candidatus Anstonellales archaeon]
MNMTEYNLDKIYIIEDLKDALGSILSGIMEMREIVRILDSEAPELDDNIKFILREDVEKSIIDLISELDNETEDFEEDEEDDE